MKKKNTPQDDGPCSLDELLNDDDDFGEEPQPVNYLVVFALGVITGVLWYGGPFLIEELKPLLVDVVMLQRFF